MLPIDNRLRLQRVFFHDPLTSFYLRELSRLSKIAPPSVKAYLKELAKENLIIVEKDRIYRAPVYRGNRDNPEFLFSKKLDTLRRIHESGLLDFLHDTCLPDVIILYGSASRGEDTPASDIDLYLRAPEKTLALEAYERRLGRKIHVFFSETLMKMHPNLVSNIMNGIILQGGLDAQICSDSSVSRKTGRKQRPSRKLQSSS